MEANVTAIEASSEERKKSPSIQDKMAHFFGVLLLVYTVYLARPGLSMTNFYVSCFFYTELTLLHENKVSSFEGPIKVLPLPKRGLRS